VVGEGARVRRALLRRAVEDPETSRPRGDDARRLDGRRGLRLGGRAHPARLRYPIAALKHEYQPAGYPDDHPFVPHGHSVIVTAPAAFRFTYEADRSAITRSPSCWPASRSTTRARHACPTCCGS
jgi:hypothetical protein